MFRGRPTHHVRVTRRSDGRVVIGRRGLPRSRRNWPAGSTTGRRARVLRGRRGGARTSSAFTLANGQWWIQSNHRYARDDHAGRRQPDCGRPARWSPSDHGRRGVIGTLPGAPRAAIDLHAYRVDGVGTLLDEGSPVTSPANGSKSTGAERCVTERATDSDVTAPHDHIGLYEGLVTTRAIRRYRDEAIPETASATCFSPPPGPRAGPTVSPSVSSSSPTDRWRPRPNDSSATAPGGSGRPSATRTATTTDRGRSRIPQVADGPHHAALRGQLRSGPGLVLACFVPYRDTSPADGASVFPACQNLLLAARALGYGGVLTGWHYAVEAELRALLQIPETRPSAPPSPWGDRSVPTVPSGGVPFKSWSTARNGERPRIGPSIRPGVEHAAAGPPPGP